jgi:hypothetical protein
MGKEYVINTGERRDRELGSARSGVNQYVIINQHGGGLEMPAPYSATTAKHSELHADDPIFR